MTSFSLNLHLQIQTATFHITAASKTFNERDSAIVVSQIESRYPMSKLQKQSTTLNFFLPIIYFSRNVSQKWWGRGTDMFSASKWRRAGLSTNWRKTFEKFSRQWTIPGAVSRQKIQSNFAISHVVTQRSYFSTISLHFDLLNLSLEIWPGQKMTHDLRGNVVPVPYHLHIFLDPPSLSIWQGLQQSWASLVTLKTEDEKDEANRGMTIKDN